MLVNCCWVKLVVGLYINKWFKSLFVVFRLLYLLDLLDFFDIFLYKVSGIWFIVVGDYLNWCGGVGVFYLFCKIYWNNY